MAKTETRKEALERFAFQNEMFKLMVSQTRSGKLHLHIKMYIDGCVGSVARTMCYCLIKEHSTPVFVDFKDIESDPNLCKTCKKTVQNSYYDEEVRHLLFAEYLETLPE